MHAERLSAWSVLRNQAADCPAGPAIGLADDPLPRLDVQRILCDWRVDALRCRQVQDSEHEGWPQLFCPPTHPTCTIPHTSCWRCGNGSAVTGFLRPGAAGAQRLFRWPKPRRAPPLAEAALGPLFQPVFQSRQSIRFSQALSRKMGRVPRPRATMLPLFMMAALKLASAKVTCAKNFIPLDGQCVLMVECECFCILPLP